MYVCTYCVCVCMYVDVADGTARFSRGSTDGENEGELEIAFSGRCELSNGSCCHGSVCLNDDSTTWRSIPLALRVILNPIDVHGRQRVH